MVFDAEAARDMELVEQCRQYDAAIKRVLAHKPFLAHIMRACMPEYSACSIDDIVNRYIEGEPQIAHVGVDVDETNPRIAGLNTEDATLTEGRIYYDIRYSALAPKGDELIRIIINVEAQNRSNPGYSLLKRAIYYCSRMISAQKGVEFTGSDYDKVKKVYSVWICPNAPKSEQNSITSYSVKEASLAGSVSRNSDEYDLLSVILICLGDAEDGARDLRIPSDRNILRMLEVLLKGKWTARERKTIIESEFGIQMTEQITGEVGHMCNLSQGVYEDGIRKGMTQGIAQGIAQGMTQGEMKKAKDVALSMRRLGMPIETIAEIVKVDLALAREWLAGAEAD